MTTESAGSPHKLSLERFAELRGKLAAGEPREIVLADADLSSAQWEQELLAWMAELGRDLERGESNRLHRYVLAVRAAQGVDDGTAPTGDVPPQRPDEAPPLPFATPEVGASTASPETLGPRRGPRTMLLRPPVASTEEVDMAEVRAAVARGAMPFSASSPHLDDPDARGEFDMRAIRAELASAPRQAPTPLAAMDVDHGTKMVDMRAVRERLAEGVTPFEAANAKGVDVDTETAQVDMRTVREHLAQGATPFEALAPSTIPSEPPPSTGPATKRRRR